MHPMAAGVEPPVDGQPVSFGDVHHGFVSGSVAGPAAAGCATRKAPVFRHIVTEFRRVGARRATLSAGNRLHLQREHSPGSSVRTTSWRAQQQDVFGMVAAFVRACSSATRGAIGPSARCDDASGPRAHIRPQGVVTESSFGRVLQRTRPAAVAAFRAMQRPPYDGATRAAGMPARQPPVVPTEAEGSPCSTITQNYSTAWSWSSKRPSRFYVGLPE